MVILIVLGVFAIIAVFASISIYNNLVRYRVESENAWSQIDVQLKRRYDLIPNLVESVKGVMNFEKDTLTKVMEARAKAMGAPIVSSDRMKAEGEISGCLSRLLAVWENYPALKSNQNAMQLQEELTSTENRVAYTRSHYNDISANYNALIQQFPSNVVAGMYGFQKKDYLEVQKNEKVGPQVKLT